MGGLPNIDASTMQTICESLGDMPPQQFVAALADLRHKFKGLPQFVLNASYQQAYQQLAFKGVSAANTVIGTPILDLAGCSGITLAWQYSGGAGGQVTIYRYDDSAAAAQSLPTITLPAAGTTFGEINIGPGVGGGTVPTNFVQLVLPITERWWQFIFGVGGVGITNTVAVWLRYGG